MNYFQSAKVQIALFNDIGESDFSDKFDLKFTQNTGTDEIPSKPSQVNVY